jgi:hypothetical protein
MVVDPITVLDPVSYPYAAALFPAVRKIVLSAIPPLFPCANPKILPVAVLTTFTHAETVAIPLLTTLEFMA